MSTYDEFHSSEESMAKAPEKISKKVKTEAGKGDLPRQLETELI